MNSSSPVQHGFSLVEMAIVLTIVGIMMAGLLPTISGQIEQKRRSETAKQISDIKDALFGFAIINGYLPCPTIITDPADIAYGTAPATCTGAPSAEGILPWRTLGVPETDAWGSKRESASTSWNGYWHYRVDRNFATSGVTLSTGFSADALSIRDNNGNTVTSSSENPIAIVFSTGPNLAGDGQNSSTNLEVPGIFQSDTPSSTFDDMLIWISRPQLFNRLVTSGKLP
jgi:prepilin-type N-terminal cleavage/methylation domain-containing protein